MSELANYKDCHIDDFKAAIKLKNADPKTISTEYLYILYTKYKADAFQCYRAQTSYGNDIAKKSEDHAELFRKELISRLSPEECVKLQIKI